MKRIIVVGAGIGGMVSAAYLAHKGFNVEIFEKNLKPGGKMNEFRIDGYRFDTGPSLITMPYVFREFFEEIGRDAKDYFELTELDNACRYFWSDGTVFNSYCDENKLSSELIEVFGETEADNFFRYLDYGKIFFELSEDSFLKDEFKIRNYLSKKGLLNFSKFISGRSINDLSNKFFKNNKLKQLMDRFATYNGSTPYLAPQFFSIIPYVEFKFGAWYVKGGIYEIAKGLEKLCREMNVKINYGFELTDTEYSGKNISKLVFKTKETELAEEKDFDILVSNFTGNKKLTDEEYFENDDWSCSGFILLIGMEKEFKGLSHHNILFSEDYEKEFIDIFEKKIPADDMTVYISVSKKDQPEDSPEGCENWFVLVNAPFLNHKFEWTDKNKTIYKDKIIRKIESFTNVSEGSLTEHIKFCEIFTPEDFLKTYNSEHGSIYGLSSNTLYTIMKRPKNKSNKFDNLYFTGGKTHPGGGVPLCFLSGKIVSKLIN
jgi:phytoene desaturase